MKFELTDTERLGNMAKGKIDYVYIESDISLLKRIGLIIYHTFRHPLRYTIIKVKKII